LKWSSELIKVITLLLMFGAGVALGATWNHGLVWPSGSGVAAVLAFLAYLKIERDDRKEMSATDQRVADLKTEADAARQELAAARVAAGPDPAVEVDRKLFEKFQKEMPMWLISFFRDSDMGGPFLIKNHTILDDFQVHWQNPDHAFHSAVLEARRIQLGKLAHELAFEIATNTWHRPNNVHQGVPPEWEHEDPERLHKVVKKLNKLSGNFAKQCEEFILEAKRELRV
jgi:hypothetical protein